MQYLRALKKHLLTFVSIIVCFNVVTNDGECIRNRKNQQEQPSLTDRQQRRRKMNEYNRNRRDQQFITDVKKLPTLEERLNGGYVEPKNIKKESYNSNINKQRENLLQLSNNQYNKVDASKHQSSQNIDKSIKVISSNQLPPPPPTTLQPHVVQHTPTVETNKNVKKGISLEEELIQKKNMLKKVVKDENNDKVESEKNFLQQRLSEAIIQRYANLHMYDDIDDGEEDDDWD